MGHLEVQDNDDGGLVKSLSTWRDTEMTVVGEGLKGLLDDLAERWRSERRQAR